MMIPLVAYKGLHLILGSDWPSMDKQDFFPQVNISDVNIFIDLDPKYKYKQRSVITVGENPNTDTKIRKHTSEVHWSQSLHLILYGLWVCRCTL